MVDNPIIPQDIQTKLDELKELLHANPVVQEFRSAQEAIETDESLKEAESEMKREQKEAVHAKHYDKLNAQEAAETRSDALREAIDDNVKVVHYREALTEANDLLQYLTSYVQSTLEDKIEERYQDTLKNYKQPDERRD